MKGSNTSKVIRYNKILLDKRGDICHSHVACKVRPEKDDLYRTRITVTGGKIFYSGEVATPNGSLELIKLMINNVLSRPGTRFACFNINNFYLDTPLEDPEYVCIKLTDIPQEVIDEYNLTKYLRHGWIYFAIIRSTSGLK